MFYNPDTDTKIPEGAAFKLGHKQFPDNWLNLSTAKEKKDEGIFDLVIANQPVYNPRSQTCTEGPIVKINKVWTATWVVSRIAEEVLERNLAYEKNIKKNLINSWRSKENNTFFVHNGKQISCDNLSRGDIDAVAGNISLRGAFPEGFPGAWKCIDNTYIPIQDLEDFKSMYASMTRQGTMNFMRAQELKEQIANSTSIEELDAIKWEQN